MNNTYQTLYVDEVRNVSITLLNQSNIKYNPTSSSTFQVIDSDDNIVISETNASVSDNVLTALIDTDVTGVIGDYYIIWKIYFDYGYIHYHKTKLSVISAI